jgi:CDGSH-type Zn-finger protein
VALCRCGASSRKQFCDGTHGKIGFEGGQDALTLRSQETKS